MPEAPQPRVHDATLVTKAPRRLLAALIVLTVTLVWALVLTGSFDLRHGEDLLVLVLLVVSVALLAATAVMQVAGRRASAASELAGWRLSAFTAASNEVAWETTVDGVVTFAGPHLAEVLGYEPDEVLGANSASLLAPGQLERLQALRAEAVATTKGWTGRWSTSARRAS